MKLLMRSDGTTHVNGTPLTFVADPIYDNYFCGFSLLVLFT